MLTNAEIFSRLDLSGSEVQWINDYLRGKHGRWLSDVGMEAFDRLMYYFCVDAPERYRMPYGVAKARTGCPDQWMTDFLRRPIAKVERMCNLANSMVNLNAISRQAALVMLTRLWNTIDGGLSLLHGEDYEEVRQARIDALSNAERFYFWQANEVFRNDLWELMADLCPWAFKNARNTNTLYFTYWDDPALYAASLKCIKAANTMID